MNYVVVGQHSWNRKLFKEHLQFFPGAWWYVDNQEDLEQIAKVANPRYIFFLHWSEIVPKWLVEKYECVCFHPTDLPYGRGGTPIQNLILRGHKTTVLTAFRMTSELDAGPVYYKAPLLLRGSLRTIFSREMNVAAQMVGYIVKHEPVPDPQAGEPVYFTRRKPEESEIDSRHSLDQLYDHIRMLDAPGYPPATITLDNVVLEITQVRKSGGILQAKVKVREL